MHVLLPKLCTTLIVVFSLFSSVTSLANEQDETQKMLENVDQLHQKFVHQFYRTLLKQPAYKKEKYPSIAALQKKIKTANGIDKTALIINNLNMIKGYNGDPAIFSIIKTLLDANAYQAATTLLDEVKDQGDTNISAHANYLLASYYFQREQWQQVLELLTDEISFLDNKKHHHSLLMRGVSHQALTAHYQAISEYEKIPSKSEYYNSAQLNLAIANLRQGWWTDGHIIIKRLLKEQKENPHEATLNRLYITLAYSLLNQGYYRTARSTFHQIGVESQYANQAILGIALTAAQQGDEMGAINASRALKQKTQDELPVHEAHLLIPFFYEKSQQLIAASTGYTQATDYYREKIKTLQQLITNPVDLSNQAIQPSAGNKLTLAGNLVDFSAYYPDYYFKNRMTMLAYAPLIERDNLQKKHNQLNNAYQQLTSKMAETIIQRRIDHLTSYLNQSRYGLARLFDNNTAEQ